MSRATELAEAFEHSGEDCRCRASGPSECACDAVWGEYHMKEAAALLREQEALLRQALDALEPHKSTVLRWYTPTDAAIQAIKEHLK